MKICHSIFTHSNFCKILQEDLILWVCVIIPGVIESLIMTNWVTHFYNRYKTNRQFNLHTVTGIDKCCCNLVFISRSLFFLGGGCDAKIEFWTYLTLVHILPQNNSPRTLKAFSNLRYSHVDGGTLGKMHIHLGHLWVSYSARLSGTWERTFLEYFQ